MFSRVAHRRLSKKHRFAFDFVWCTIPHGFAQKSIFAEASTLVRALKRLFLRPN